MPHGVGVGDLNTRPRFPLPLSNETNRAATHLVPAIASLLVLAVLPVLAPPSWAPSAALDAQEGSWDFAGEVGGALFFGNTSQTTFTTRLATEMADSVREFSVDGRFFYGQARTDEGRSFVNKRSWKVATSYTHEPSDRFSAFLSSDVEGSLERRIDRRYDLGLGAKMRLQRFDRGRTDLSVTLLAERTEVRGSEEDDELLARWSARLRLRRSLAEERLSLQSETQYRPEFDRLGDFTLSSTSSVGFELNRTVTLKLTFVDNYDSEARARGADSNNDGQILFSVLSSF